MLREINSYVQSMEKEFQIRKMRPRYHFSTPAGWMNDPHAPVWFHGVYHLFFNYYPFEAEGVRPKCWGHAITKDFTSYTLLPTAIAPDSEFDRDGCASGCAVVHNDKLYLIYTGRNYYRQPKEVQCVAWSEDGIHFVKAKQNPVVVPRKADEMDFRDPWVYKKGGEWRMLLGSKNMLRPCLFWYASDNLVDWEYGGIFAEGGETQGDMWECPSLWSKDNQTVLLISPEHIEGVRQKSAFLIGDHYEDLFSALKLEEVDYGCDFYAAQFFEDNQGNTFINAWMNKWENQHCTKKEGWIGSMTMPRTFCMSEDKGIEGTFLPQLKSLRKNERILNNIVLKDKKQIPSILDNASMWLRVETEWTVFEGNYFETIFFANTSGDGGLKIRFAREDNVIYVDNLTVDHQSCKRKISIDPKFWTDKFYMDVLIDVTCVEISINRKIFITDCVYPNLETDIYSHYWASDKVLDIDRLMLYDMKDAIVEFRMTD